KTSCCFYRPARAIAVLNSKSNINFGGQTLIAPDHSTAISSISTARWYRQNDELNLWKQWGIPLRTAAPCRAFHRLANAHEKAEVSLAEWRRCYENGFSDFDYGRYASVLVSRRRLGARAV